MDRLADLKIGLLSKDSHSIDIRQEDEVKSTNSMQLFLLDIERATHNIGTIKDAAVKIFINCTMISTQNSEQQESLKTEMEKLIQSTNRIASSTKSQIQSLRTACDKFKVSGRYQPQDYRIRDTLVVTLTRKYVEIMQSYQSAQLKYSAELKQTISRRIRILNPSISNEQVSEVMATGVGVNELVSETIMQGESDLVHSAVVSVKDKYKDVLELERSIAELTQMFQDLALLVDQQGGLLDRIEENVKRAGDFIAGGNEELHESVRLQISLRYKQCCLATTVVLVLAGIITIIFLKAKGVF